MAFKAKYVGDPADKRKPSEPITHRGVVFEPGKSVEVSDALGKKLQGNNHFEVTGSEGKSDGKTPASSQAPAAEPSVAEQDGSNTLASDNIAEQATELQEKAYGEPEGTGTESAAQADGARGRGSRRS